ncbi:hypothetical protein ACM55G_11915 [Flavobacterium sp. LB3P122]|uniref:hypothetical protein n=1 Tax=Flavobacterium algoriphilum TaxID=3398738 RepID=UPI003A87B935
MSQRHTRKAIIKKAHFILKISEINLTIGGAKNPRYPIVEIEVSTLPLLKPFDFPAILKINGTTQETPIQILKRKKHCVCYSILWGNSFHF